MTTSSPVSPRTRRFIMAVDRFVLFITKHWLSVAVVGLLIFAGLPFLAPMLMHYGFIGLADLIYKVYSLSCHQMAYRTFFLFGEQPAYTLVELQGALGVANPADDAFFWREFIGNASLGYKMAWCERDAAIYASMLLAALLFGLVRTRLKPLDWRVYLLFITPMAIDGTWQLFTSPLHLLPFLPVHESNYLLRSITGGLFGIGSVWLIFPYIEEAMRDTYNEAHNQYARALAREAEARGALHLSGNP
jgi:uncharacterized membrane protein